MARCEMEPQRGVPCKDRKGLCFSLPTTLYESSWQEKVDFFFSYLAMSPQFNWNGKKKKKDNKKKETESRTERETEKKE